MVRSDAGTYVSSQEEDSYRICAQRTRGFFTQYLSEREVVEPLRCFVSQPSFRSHVMTSSLVRSISVVATLISRLDLVVP